MQTVDLTRRGSLRRSIEVLVLRLHVTDSFLRRMYLVVANEGRVRIGDVIEKVVNRFLPDNLCVRKGKKDHRDKKM